MNNSSLPTSPARHPKSPPFNSPLLHANTLHQHQGIYNAQGLPGGDHDPQLMNPALAYGSPPFYASQQSFSMQAMPMYQQQRPTSFPRTLGAFPHAPTGVFGSSVPTVNPQLTLSPPPNPPWIQQSYFSHEGSSIEQQQQHHQSSQDHATFDKSIFEDPRGFHLALLENNPKQELQQPLPSVQANRGGLGVANEASLKHDDNLPVTGPGPHSDSSNGVVKSKRKKITPRDPVRRPTNNNGRPSKRPRRQVESEDDDVDSDDDEAARANKYHKACHHCRKQKSKCHMDKNSNTCKSCQLHNRECFVELRPERRLPISRKVLQAELDKKNAIIELFSRMLKPYMLQHPGEENLSSGSPPSSAAYEEPLRKQVLEWLEKAEASRVAFTSMDLNGRAFNETSSSSDDDEAKPTSHDGEHYQQQDYSGGRQPRRPGLRSSARSASGMSGLGMAHLELSDSRSTPSRSPRASRGANLSIRHPVGVLAAASLRGAAVNTAASHAESSVGEPPLPISPSSVDIGVARHDYFISGDPMAAKFSQLGLRRIEIDRGLSEEPKLLRKGLIEPPEVDKLFAIFYEKLNPSINLLDETLHKPATTFARCPLLFTVVCAVASRYHTERPELYSIAMHFAMTSAASSLTDSKKSVELCQAYLLLSLWPLPCRKYDEDRAWIYLGLAIRMAMDLNLHIPVDIEAANEEQEREILNRTRTWIVCFNMDRSTSAQLGKPMTIRENYLIHKSEDWYRRSKYNTPYDIHLCQITALMRIMSRAQDTIYADVNTPSGIKEDLDLRQTAFEFDDEIVAWEQRSAALLAAEETSDDPRCRYRRHLLPFYANYSRLVILSFGFQYSLSMGLLTPGDDLITRCLDAAQKVIAMMVNDPVMRPYLRHAPDSHLVFASFASAFLLKLLRHKFVHLIEEEKRMRIIPLVERFIRVLSDSSVSIDDSHMPKIYARFLDSLLQKHRMYEAEAAQKYESGGGAAANGVEPRRDQDTAMDTRESGLAIDLNTVHQDNTSLHGQLLSPSSHPSIQFTPPSYDDETYGRYTLPESIDHVLNGQSTVGMAVPDFGYEMSLGDSATLSGSGTATALDDVNRDGKYTLDNILSGSFWPHESTSSVPPPAAALNSWEKDLFHQFFPGFDG